MPIFSVTLASLMGPTDNIGISYFRHYSYKAEFGFISRVFTYDTIRHLDHTEKRTTNSRFFSQFSYDKPRSLRKAEIAIPSWIKRSCFWRIFLCAPAVPLFPSSTANIILSSDKPICINQKLIKDISASCTIFSRENKSVLLVWYCQELCANFWLGWLLAGNVNGL